mmetsp:Transcript_18852/g.47364  ORF Transcript_18852/g.47364 Transcript_18852/m.47364 type:complete len:206 (-) Transcript_18852:160-777(-)
MRSSSSRGLPSCSSAKGEVGSSCERCSACRSASRKSMTWRSSSTASVVCAAPETAERPDELAPSWRSSEKCEARPASGRWQLSIGRTAVLSTSVSRWREARRMLPVRGSAEWTTQLRLAARGTGRSSRPGRQKSSESGGIEMGSSARWLALVWLSRRTETPARLAAARPLSSGSGGGGGAAETNSSKAVSKAVTSSSPPRLLLGA